MELQLIASGTQNILKWCEGWALTPVAEVWKSWLVIPPTAACRRLTLSMSVSKVRRKFDDSNLSGKSGGNFPGCYTVKFTKLEVKGEGYNILALLWCAIQLKLSSQDEPISLTGPSSTLIQNMLSKVAVWSCRRWGRKGGVEGPWKGFHGSINPSLHLILLHYFKEKISMFESLFFFGCGRSKFELLIVKLLVKTNTIPVLRHQLPCL